MKVLFMSNINHQYRAGLFTSVTNRTEHMIKNYISNYESLSLINTDNRFSKILKKILKKDLSDPITKSFYCNGILYKYIVNRNNIIRVLLRKLFPKYIKYEFLQLLSSIEINQYDLIQAHWAYPVGYIAKSLKDKYDIPYVLTVHGSDIHTLPYKNKKIKKCVIEALESANKVIFVSDNLLDIAKSIGYSGNNSVIIQNGVDLNLFNILNKKEIKKQLDITCKVVGFVGNLIDVKRAEILPDIFESIKENYKNVEFMVLGDGNLKSKIVDQCMKKQLKVRFLGHVNQCQVPYYINAMDVLILPSRAEGFPSVVIEANACGVKVVGSNASGIPEAVGRFGEIINEGRDFEEKFSRKVVDVLKSDYNSEELRNRTLEFKWEYISAREIEVYKSMF